MPELSDEELGIPEGLDPNIRAELRKSRELQRENDIPKGDHRSSRRARDSVRQSWNPRQPAHGHVGQELRG